MFQTEFIHAIQSISFDWLTKFILLVDSTGTHKFISSVLIIIIFGINFRKGIFIAQTVVWTQLFTQILKGYFALPRPYHVDSNIKLLYSGQPNSSPFNNMGAQGFFEKLPSEVVNYYRSVAHYSYGFPSGHSSGAMTLWGSMAVVFKKKWLFIIGITFIVLVAFARLYLGKHFFIDVLGGLALGMLVISFSYFIFSNERIKRIKLHWNRYSINFINIIYLIVIPFLVLFLTRSKFAAELIGLNLGFLLIGIDKIPIDSGSVLKRIMRVGVAFIICIAITSIISYIYEISFIKEIRILRLFKHLITYFFIIYGTTKFLLFVGLYKKK